MTEGIETQPGLVKFSDSEFILEERSQDVRGFRVYDVDDEQLGVVDDLYIDQQEHEVRFLDVAAGGFLGLGERHFLLPVQAVIEVGEERLTVDQSRQKVVDSPPFETGVVPRARRLREIYEYYGYPSSGHDAAPRTLPPRI